MRKEKCIYCTIEKNPHISGPVELKPMLFKGKLYSRGSLKSISVPFKASITINALNLILFPISQEFKLPLSDMDLLRTIKTNFKAPQFHRPLTRPYI